MADTSRSLSSVQGGFRKQIRSKSPDVGHTPQHTPLLRVKLDLVGEEVEAVMDTGASASIVGKRLAHMLGICTRVRKINIRQRDRCFLETNLVVNNLFQTIDSSLVLGRFVIDAKVLYIRN